MSNDRYSTKYLHVPYSGGLSVGVQYCNECGVLVGDPAVHDNFHDKPKIVKRPMRVVGRRVV